MISDGIKVSLVHVGTGSGDFPLRSYPLGLMMLAACVERDFPGASADLLDMKVTDAAPEDAGRILAERKPHRGGPDVVGLSAMSVHAPLLRRAAGSIRAALPGALIVAGGPHPTSFPSEVLRDGNIDAVVLGEGELVFEKILRAVAAGGALDDIRGVGTASRLEPGERDFVRDVDTLPFPAWDKVDIARYSRYSSFALIGPRRYMSVLTSRGCPYGCVYCHDILGKTFRPRSAELVLEELRALSIGRGIRDIEIVDDVFNLNRQRVVDICEGIIGENMGLRLEFPNGLRGDLLDDDLLRLMRRAGAAYLGFAVETGSPRIQKLIHKNLDVERTIRAIRTASKLGIFCSAFFMVDFPTETEAELRATVRFAVKSPLQVAHFVKVTPFMDTPMFSTLDEKTREYIRLHPEAMRYDNFDFSLGEVPAGRLRSIIRSAFLRFYLNPFRVAAILRRHPYRAGIFNMARYAVIRMFMIKRDSGSGVRDSGF